MAAALQCPGCHTRTRLDTVGGATSFQCPTCGRTLKVPPGARPRPAAPAPSGPAPPDVPRRAPRSAAPSAGGTAMFDPVPVAGPRTSPIAGANGGPYDDANGGPPRRGRNDVPAPEAPRPVRDALPLPLRALAWVLAIPLALAIVGLPARRAGYLTSQKLLDVIVQHDMGRFAPLAVIVVLWAVVTTVLVTIFVDGGRIVRKRRQARHLGPDGSGPNGVGSSAGPMAAGSAVAGTAPGRSTVAVTTVAPPPRRSR